MFEKSLSKNEKVDWFHGTNMDAVPSWDLSYFDVLCELENHFRLTFSEEEASQLFEIGHISNVVRAKLDGAPQEDVTHALLQIHEIKRKKAHDHILVMISASSTREACCQYRTLRSCLTTG